ncbi:MAG: phosphoribosylaminoimidazolesuccinocarboxamide synthase [Phycisphaerae bacterium]|jgi:phosphoribosylaminoimidazole-succinocarboxamide synthase
MNEQRTAVAVTDLPGLRNRGKVRDVYDLGQSLMIVATDRISAFDVVMNEPVPDKGVVLTAMTQFWLETLPACAANHLEYVVGPGHVPPGYEQHAAQLNGRAMVVRKASVLPVECVVRGYLVGGGWKEYRGCGSVSGVQLPAGLRLAEKLAEPIFTPSTKATDGHDEPISFEQACATAAEFMMAGGAAPGAGEALMRAARQRSLEIYRQARDYAQQRGIIIADTKFEFGVWRNQLLLIDEVLTPDSSRFWPATDYEVGRTPASFDKQYLRDYLAETGWNKHPPPPPLPDEVVKHTRARYLEAYRLLTGRELAHT